MLIEHINSFLKLERENKMFTAPVGAAPCRWLWGICGQSLVEAAVGVTEADAEEELGEPLEGPYREKQKSSCCEDCLKIGVPQVY